MKRINNQIDKLTMDRLGYKLSSNSTGFKRIAHEALILQNSPGKPTFVPVVSKETNLSMLSETTAKAREIRLSSPTKNKRNCDS